MLLQATPRRTECIHLLFDASRIVLQDRTCLQNSHPMGVGETNPLSATSLPISFLSGSKTAVLQSTLELTDGICLEKVS